MLATNRVNALYATEFCAGEVMSDFAGLFELEPRYLGYELFALVKTAADKTRERLKLLAKPVSFLR